MLIIFKSKSSPEVCMYKEHAQRILDLLHKDHNRGVITAAEASDALSVLEKEVALSRQHPENDVEHDLHAAHNLQEEANLPEHLQDQRVSFAARAYPFIEMLRAAKADDHDIVWGV